MISQSKLQPHAYAKAFENTDANLNLFGKVDENAEREKRYQEALAKYPASSKMGCDQLESMIVNIKNEISLKEEEKVNNMASGGSGRVQDRELYGWNKRRTELEAMYSNLKCAEIKEEAASQKFNETQISQLAKVKELSDTSGNATKYIIWGLLGVVVVVATVIIIRKTRK